MNDQICEPLFEDRWDLVKFSEQYIFINIFMDIIYIYTHTYY